MFLKCGIWLHVVVVVVVPYRGVLMWMPLVVGVLHRTVTYLLASIYRFVMLAPVSKAASRLKMSPSKQANLTPPHEE